VRARVLVPLYAALALVVTWPLAAHLTTGVTRGAEPVATVPLFNLWTLRWNQDSIGDLFRHYWDAPLFHPALGGFALSEPQPLTGLVFAPLALVTGNPVLALNLVLLAALVANGLAARRLARTLGAEPVPAAVTGGLAVALPFVAVQLGVLQLVMVFPLFLLVDAVVRWGPEGGRRAAVEVGLWLAATFLTCGYYGLFAAVVIGPAALAYVRPDWLSRSRAADIAVMALVFGVLAGPALIGQSRITADYSRDEETIEGLSATNVDFWRLPEESPLAGILPLADDGDGGHALYPGTVLLALGLAGLIVAARRVGDGEGAGMRRRRLTFLVVGFVLARVVSLGLTLQLFGYRPYELLRRWVPGFDSLRSPFRADVVGQVFTVALAAFALDAAWRWLRPEEGRARVPQPAGAALAVAVVALVLVETGVMPAPVHRVDRSTPDWAAWLADNPPDGEGDPVLAFLPFPEDGRAASYQTTVEHMLEVLDAGATTVNGYSGLFPEQYNELEGAARQYPDYVADDLMADYGVDAVVVDEEWLAGNPAAASALDATYRERYRGPESIVYEPF
jgi:hypothetical protein